jgi:hypothetical protein
MKEITRTQTGVRIETRTLKTLKALAEYLDLSLGDLLEGIVWHAFDGKPAFDDATRQKIDKIRAVYDLDLNAEDSHQIRDSSHE